jgi:hypothetical protein
LRRWITYSEIIGSSEEPLIYRLSEALTSAVTEVLLIGNLFILWVLMANKSTVSLIDTGFIRAGSYVVRYSLHSDNGAVQFRPFHLVK